MSPVEHTLSVEAGSVHVQCYHRLSDGIRNHHHDLGDNAAMSLEGGSTLRQHAPPSFINAFLDGFQGVAIFGACSGQQGSAGGSTGIAY